MNSHLHSHTYNPQQLTTLTHTALLHVSGLILSCVALPRADRPILPQVLTELLKRGADPNIGDADGMTALMNSAACGDVEKLKLLLAHGAARGLHQKGAHSEGWRALGTEDKNHFQQSLASKRFQGKFTALEWAANYGHEACKRELTRAAALCHNVRT